TYFDFSRTGGYLRTAEKCNGAGDCRKTHIIGGTLCPSFQATKNEMNSTRARANILRELITNSTQKNPFMEKEAYEVLDLCLLCKACKSECPSGVDVAKLKMEFLQHYYDNYGIPLRSRAVAYLPKMHKLASIMPHIANFFMGNKFFAKIIQKSIDFSTKRNLPLLSTINLKKEIRQIQANTKNDKKKTICLFVDEFSKYLDKNIVVDTVFLFSKLGYEVRIAKFHESGRTWLSKGLVRKAKKIANKNIEYFAEIVSKDMQLVGIEPSAILSFRDEYPDLAYERNKTKSQKLAENTFLFDEFICNEMAAGNITSEMFTDAEANILFHGHCQQKSLIGTKFTKQALSLPKNFTVSEIPSGCCGMAGSFGYEKEHYDLSMQIGELVLFPAIRKADANTIIAAVGTSCRCQIKDGTNVDALHPIEILRRALKE
ncbi:MAG: 4Fe-4S dicluster domain-containing protein, partial [Bacteroidales bacterium]|nr:4Fe-4S dicluster domain-containing protein [Bacteroidales bacterium]